MRGVRATAAALVLAGVVAVGLTAVVGAARSDPGSSSAPSLPGASAAGPPEGSAVAAPAGTPGATPETPTAPTAPTPTNAAAPLPVTYGVAEPAGALPGAQTPDDIAAWNQIRSDVVGSGACWLRSDLDQWLTRAIQAFDWLGTSGPCTATAGSPIKVLAILDQQTVWGARRVCPNVTFSSTYNATRNNFTLGDWTLLVRCIAQQFKGRISAYEIWNEPLLSNSMLGYEDGSATHYFDLLKSAYTEIKAADPTATVIALGGSDVYAGGDQTRLNLMRSFTTQLVAMGAAHYADAISLHAYPWGRNDPSVWASYLAELEFHEQAWSLPVWITETGTRASDTGTQSQYMQSAYSLFLGAGVDPHLLVLDHRPTRRRLRAARTTGRIRPAPVRCRPSDDRRGCEPIALTRPRGLPGAGESFAILAPCRCTDCTIPFTSSRRGSWPHSTVGSTPVPPRRRRPPSSPMTARSWPRSTPISSSITAPDDRRSRSPMAVRPS